MPKLVDDDGNVVMDGLTNDEIDQLSDYEPDGLEFDVPEADYSHTVEERDPDAEPEKLVKDSVPDRPGDGDGLSGDEDEEDDTTDTRDEVEVEPSDRDDPSTPHEYDIVGGELHFEYDSEKADEMASRDETEIEDRYDVKLDETKKSDKRDKARWANLVKQLNEYGDDVEVRKRERDERIQKKSWTENRGHEALEARAKRNNVIHDLKEGFRQMVSRPTPKPATTGPQMDPTNVVRKAAGDPTIQQLFEEEVVVETGERCIGLATDISGSMGSSIDELKIAGGAIAEATQIIGDDFVWEAFTDQHYRSHTPSEERLDLRIVTGPDEEFEWEQLDSFGACRNEPTAAGVRDCRMLMDQTSAREYTMIVITDGMALVCEDGEYHGRDGEPVEQARQAVEECRDSGIEVIGLGIGSMSDRMMEETFGGNNYRLTSIDTLAEDVLEIYASQMNVNRGGF